MPECCLRHEEIAEQIGPERARELILADLAEFLFRVLFGGVVDEDVELAEFADDPFDCARAELLRTDITCDGQAAAPLLLDEALRLSRIVSLVEVDDRNIRAFAREQDRDGAADAAVAAGDQRDLALQPSAARIARLVSWTRTHFGLTARLLVLGLRRKCLGVGTHRCSVPLRRRRTDCEEARVGCQRGLPKAVPLRGALLGRVSADAVADRGISVPTRTRQTTPGASF